MPQGDPRPGEKYLHFKQRLYQVVTAAVHSETGETLVIYQALYGDYQVYARPLSMFISPVDAKKYPDAKQKFRFQLAEPDAELPKEAAYPKMGQEPLEKRVGIGPAPEQPVQAGGTPEEKMMLFFDTDTMEEKYRILCSMEECITDHMINNMAVTLDVVIEEGDLDQRFEELKQCVRTFRRYENTRFR